MPQLNCYFCRRPITVLTGRSSQSHVDHHIDEDRSNNDPSNITDAHRGCHSRHHANTQTPEQRKRMSVAKEGNQHRAGHSPSAANRAATSAHLRHLNKSRKGQPWSPARRAAQRRKRDE